MLTPFSIIADPSGPKVVIDGTDVTDKIRRATVDLECVEGVCVPKVFLELVGQGGVEGEGVVHVVQHEPADPILAVTSWLSNLDPDELDRAMLEQFGSLEGGGDASTTGQACLAVMKAWARGD